MKKILSTGLFLLSVTGFAQAGAITYSDQASWLSATSSVTTIDFNTGTNQVYRGSSYTESGVTFTANNGIHSIYDINYDASYHDTGYLDLQGSTLGMNFVSNITALSFEFGDFYNNAVSLVLNNGEIFNLSSPSSAYGFFGMTSDIGFASVSITTNNSYTAFDNLSFGTASVPEPASIALLGLALAGLGFSRKKKAA